MSWTDLEPIVKIVPRAKASVSALKGGTIKVALSLSDTMLGECGKPTKCAVQLGSGENAGRIRLAFRKDGKFEIKPFEKGGARVVIPGGEGVPDGAREAEPCEVISKSATEAIIALPLAAWERQVAPPRIPPSRPATHPAKSNGSTGAGPGKIDAVTYLTGKGEKTSRLAGDWFMHKGERKPKSEIVKIINRYRENADLPSVTVAEVL